MSGTQPTMADAHPPGAQVFKLPSYCMPLPVDPPRPGIECGIGDSEPSSDEEGKDDKRMRWHKSRSPVSPFEHGPPSPVSPRYAQKMDKDDCEEGDKYDSEDDKPLKRPESPPPSQRQYSCKFDSEGVLRYKPAPGDYKPKKSEDKLTCTFKTKKAKGKPPRKSKARFVSLYGGDIDENSSVLDVSQWVLGIGRLGVYAIECSEIFEEHNINGSGLLKMTKLGHMVKLGLKIDQCEIILDGIDNLKAKSKAKRSLDKAMVEV